MTDGDFYRCRFTDCPRFQPIFGASPYCVEHARLVGMEMRKRIKAAHDRADGRELERLIAEANKAIAATEMDK